MSDIKVFHEGASGVMPMDQLDMSTGDLDNDNEQTAWVEYRCRCHGEIVHRSVHVTLKKTPSLFGGVGGFNG